MENKVKYYREQLGMTLAELSRKTGISTSEINYIENDMSKDVMLSNAISLIKKN